MSVTLWCWFWHFILKITNFMYQLVWIVNRFTCPFQSSSLTKEVVCLVQEIPMCVCFNNFFNINKGIRSTVSCTMWTMRIHRATALFSKYFSRKKCNSDISQIILTLIFQLSWKCYEMWESWVHDQPWRWEADSNIYIIKSSLDNPALYIIRFYHRIDNWNNDSDLNLFSWFCLVS